jgi:hypothetical protein
MLLSGTLALALVVVAALGSWLYLDHRGTRTEAEKAPIQATALDAFLVARSVGTVSPSGRVRV